MPESSAAHPATRDAPAGPAGAGGGGGRRSIRVLSPLLVNQIAAGEVIERPASVVKELVENALDAGATRVSVRLERGGIELVRVADNGCGIPRDELPLAITPHATSKINAADDLDRIGTLGFRGEALASIASVARVTIRSRPRDEDAAFEIAAEGDRAGEPAPTSGAEGTVIEVRNLFFNTPARRKFLRTDRTEQGRCLDWLRDLALAHPAVGFRVETESKVVLDVPERSSPRERISAVLGAELGPKLIEVSLDTLHDDRGLALWGMVGRPELARPTMAGQHVFLNGRLLRDRTVQHAIREAYRGLIEPGRHPTAVLMIEMAPAGVDVNVHPAKLEVRFRDQSLVHTSVLRAVRDALDRADLTRAVELPGGRDPAHSGKRTETRPFGTGLLQPPLRDDGVREQTVQTDRAAVERLIEALRPGAEADTQIARSNEPLVPLVPASRSEVGGELSEATPDRPEQPSSSQPSIGQPLINPATAVQVQDSYIIAEDGDGIVIIDQHALHERAMFETLLTRLESAPLQSQSMLRPVPVHATPAVIGRLDELAEPLQRLGFVLEPLGPASIGVRAAPTLLVERGVDPGGVVEDLVRRLESSAGTAAVDAEGVLHEVLDTMACKAAIKAGDRLTPSEMAALIDLRETIERSTNCPHGRPTSVRLTRTELDRLFERR